MDSLSQAQRALSPYGEAFAYVSRYPHSDSAVGMAKLLMSLFDNSPFGYRECIGSFGRANLDLALRVIQHFHIVGEDEELVAIGPKVIGLLPSVHSSGKNSPPPLGFQDAIYDIVIIFSAEAEVKLHAADDIPTEFKNFLCAHRYEDVDEEYGSVLYRLWGYQLDSQSYLVKALNLIGENDFYFLGVYGDLQRVEKGRLTDTIFEISIDVNIEIL